MSLSFFSFSQFLNDDERLMQAVYHIKHEKGVDIYPLIGPECRRIAARFWRICEEQEALEFGVSVTWHSLQEMLRLVDDQHHTVSTYLGAVTFQKVPRSFLHLAEKFLRKSWTDRVASHRLPDDSDDSDDDDRITIEVGDHRLFWRQIHELHWFKHLEEVLQAVIYRGVRNFLTQRLKCEGSFDRPKLATLASWKNILVDWCEEFHCAPFDKRRKSRRDLQNFADRIVQEAFFELRLKELYEMIAEFPDSMCGALELRDCLAHLKERDKFVENFQKVLTNRLLHSGANTSQIIHIYISAVKFLKVVLGERRRHLTRAATNPIRNYLRLRDDTVRCIVSSLTSNDDDDDDAAFEKIPAFQDTSSSIVSTLPGGDDSSDEGLTKFIGGNKKGALPTLMAIYGSSDIFVSEFKQILASKLLSTSTSVDKEVKNVELLRLQFSDAPLYACEVMLRDVQESVRITKGLKSTQQSLVVESTIVSSVFWPTIQKQEKLALHPKLDAHLANYARLYNQRKAPRQLDWWKWLGSVTLELSFDEEKTPQTFEVSPLHAALILYVQDEPEKNTAADLAIKCGVSEATIRKRMAKWINLGVVVESQDGRYTQGTMSNQTKDQDQDDDDDDDEQKVDTDQSKNEEAAVYGSYVTGMLTNLGSLTLDRMHSMLQMFANADDLNNHVLTIGELTDILRTLCDQDLIELNDGAYSLAAPAAGPK